MAAPVIVKFQVEGVAQVQNAIRTVEQAFVNTEQARTTVASKGAKERAASALKESLQESKDLGRVWKDRTKAADDAAKEQVAAWKRGDAAVASAMKTASREVESEEKKKTALIAKGAKDRADAEVREINRAEASRRQYYRAIGGAAATGLGAGVRQAAGIASNAVGQVLQLGGGFSISGALKERMDVDRMSVIASNAAYDVNAVKDDGTPDMEKRTRQDPQELARKARTVAIATGIDATELVQGTTSYIDKASDWKGGLGNMETMAKIAKSTGSKYGDVADALGMLRAQNQTMTVKQGNDMLLSIAAQSVKGSIGFAEVARNAAGLGKNAVMMTGDQAVNQSQLIGLAQVGVRGAGKAAPTVTEISNFMSTAQKNAGVIGLKTDNMDRLDNGDVASIVGQVFRKAKGSTKMMHDSVKDGGFQMSNFAMRLPLALAPDYARGRDEALKNGANANDANEAGVKAVEKTVRDATNVKGNQDVVDANFKKVMSSDEEQLNQAVKELRQSMAEALLPALRAIVPVIKDLTPGFVALITFLGNHPWIGLGGVIAGNVAASIAKAAIGEAVKNKLLSLMGGGGKPGSGGGGAGGVPGAVLATGAAVGLMGIKTYIENGMEGKERAQDFAAKVRSGEIKPADAAKQVNAAIERKDAKGAWGAAMDGMTAPFVDASARDSKQNTNDIELANSEEVRKAIADAFAQGIRDGFAAAPPIANSNAPTRQASSFVRESGTHKP